MGDVFVAIVVIVAIVVVTAVMVDTVAYTWRCRRASRASDERWERQIRFDEQSYRWPYSWDMTEEARDRFIREAEREIVFGEDCRPRPLVGRKGDAL